VSNWERGESLPPLDAMPPLAKLLKVSEREFIDALMDYQQRAIALAQARLKETFRQRAKHLVLRQSAWHA
jgi:hypothetical protein